MLQKVSFSKYLENGFWCMKIGIFKAFHSKWLSKNVINSFYKRHLTTFSEFYLKWDFLWDFCIRGPYCTNLIWSYRGFCINPSHLFKLSGNVPNKHFKFWIFSLQSKSSFYVHKRFCLGKKKGQSDKEGDWKSMS